MYCITAVISVCLIQHGTAAFACVCMFQSESLKEEEEAEQRRKKKDAEIIIKDDSYSVIKKRQDIEEMIDQDSLADWQEN